MLRRNSVIVLTFVLLASSLVSHRVRAEMSGGSVSSESGSATQTQAVLRYLDIGTAHSCGLLDNNTIKCWGLGSSGQLGYGATSTLGDGAGEMGDALATIDLGTGRTAKQIATGSSHSCAVLDNNTVKCWGLGTDGQLGYGTTTSLGRSSGQMGDALATIDLGTGRTAVAISAGLAHTCAVLDNATVKCWGLNTDGQLGLGDTDDRGDDPGEMGDALAIINLGTGRTAVAISAGSAHTCAILDNATVKCWGGGAFGQLGVGSVDSIGDGSGEMGNALAAVSLGTGRTVKALSSGDAHTCAILDNNSVKCWGGNGNGRLGYGDTDDRGDTSGEMGDALSAVSLGTGRTANSISLGSGHTCVILDNSEVKCWGRGLAGRLGIATSSDMGDASGEMGESLSVVDLGTSRSAKAIKAGDAHTCAVLDNFTVKCWGSGSNGRLGTGATLSLGDEANEMGNALNAISLGTSRTINAITEPSRVGSLSTTSGDGQVALAWSTPATGGASISDYLIEYSANSGTTWTTFVDAVTSALSATVTSLTNGTAYQFRVTAKNTIGSGAVSANSSAVTPTTSTTTSTTTSSSTSTTSTTVAPSTSTTTSTTTSSSSQSQTTTATTSTTVASSTSTSTTSTTVLIASEPQAPVQQPVVEVTKQLVVQPFAPLSARLSPEQVRKLNRFAQSLTKNDEVTCVGYAGDGPAPAMAMLAKQRAQNVCRLIASIVRGVSIKVTSISMGRLTTNSLTESKGALIGNGKVRKVVVKVKLAQN
jgi:alpha-tubulin suppressor-like RCC1 family protein